MCDSIFFINNKKKDFLKLQLVGVVNKIKEYQTNRGWECSSIPYPKKE